MHYKTIPINRGYLTLATIDPNFSVFHLYLLNKVYPHGLLYVVPQSLWSVEYNLVRQSTRGVIRCTLSRACLHR